jgi:hypothetical protein
MFWLMVGVCVQTTESQSKYFTVTTTASSSSTAEPGTVHTAAVSIRNNTSQHQTYDGTMGLPAGWKQVTRELPFKIEPGEIEIRLLMFSVPTGAAPDSYTITYTVRDRQKVIRAATATISMVVPHFDLLELNIVHIPQYTIAGMMIVTEVSLTNQGNTFKAVRLKFRSSHAYPVQTDSTVIHLHPNERRSIRISVLTDGTSERTDHTLEVIASLTDDESVMKKVSGVVKIIPGVVKVKEEFREFPVVARLTGVGQNEQYGIQGELSGSGSMNAARTDNFEFLFRAPETQSVSLYGLRDEYRMSYRSDNMRLYAGDQNFSLSPLTEIGRTAAGIGGSSSLGKWHGGGFYNETRRMSPRQKEAGGFVKYQIEQNASLGINYLHKQDQTTSDVATVRTLFKPLDQGTIDLEFGIGKHGGKSDNAFAARVEGVQQWLSYDLRYIRAGPQYGGYYRDMDFFSASINTKVNRRLRFISYARIENRNTERDTLQLTAPREHHYQIGAAYSENFSLLYRQITREDMFDRAAYRMREDAVQTRVGIATPMYSLFTNADIGIQHDHISRRTSPFQRYAVNSTYRPGDRYQYGGSIEYEAVYDTVGRNNQERIMANVNALIQLGEYTKLTVNLFSSGRLAAPAQSYHMMEAALDRMLPKNHTLSLRGRVIVNTPSAAPPLIAYTLNYAIPLSVPYQRITEIGQLRGSLRDQNGKGIENILLMIGGQAAVTDSKGSFFFPSLAPGTNHLSIDRVSLGFQNITSLPMPMELHIRGGEETKITLWVNKSSVFSGTITLFAEKNQNILDTSSVLVDIGGSPGVFVSLTMKNEIHRRVTDSRGMFLIEDVRPGVWLLRVTGGNIPKYHTIEPDSMLVDLLPGGKLHVNIQIHPEARTIKILNQGAATP